MIKLDLTGLNNFVAESEIEAAIAAAQSARARVLELPMHGWVSLPSDITAADIAKLNAAGARIAEQSDALVVLGAGGSSLGARALLDALPGRGDVKEVFYAGDNLSGVHMARLSNALQSREFSVVVTSKSGTTTEPAAALRVMLKLLRARYGEALKEHLFVVAGEHKSALRDYAENLGCELFGIPEEVGGRYSVFTASGLLPAAARGLDIAALLRGASAEAGDGLEAAVAYAAARQKLNAGGFTTEILASFEPDARNLGEWWKQLFGESEGKQQRGIFPATVSFSGDLHSMGQYIQDGRRNLFETIVSFTGLPTDVEIPPNREFDDGFAFLGGWWLNDVNDVARQSVRAAHIDGGVPVAEIIAPGLNEASLGALLYFFEYACAVSACIDGVNPFDQPGVEAYKTIMRAKLK
ncbi:MAG: glucose-6-phosphate isomerase [Oscillospiraceae bacterium]|jgi:glucose-6-phosphate isomerase|nr:glucose-6-phosphate isomerase [Oscillospiraceae bacterium]